MGLIKNKKGLLIGGILLGCILGIYIWNIGAIKKDHILYSIQYKESKTALVGISLDNYQVIRNIKLDKNYNNIAVHNDNAYISVYRDTDKVGLMRSGKEFRKLNLSSPQLGKTVTMDGHTPTDILVLDDKVLIETRFLNRSPVASGFEVYDEQLNFLYNINFEEAYVSFKWKVIEKKYIIVLANKLGEDDIHDWKTVAIKIDYKTHKILDKRVIYDSDFYDFDLMENDLVIAFVDRDQEKDNSKTKQHDIWTLNINSYDLKKIMKIESEPIKLYSIANKNRLLIADHNKINIINYKERSLLKSIQIPGIRDWIIKDNKLCVNQRFLLTNFYQGDPQITIVDLDSYQVIKEIKGTFGTFAKAVN